MAQRCDPAGPLATNEPHEAASEAARLADLLEGLAAQGTTPERRRRLEEVRRDIDRACRARFDESLQSVILDGMAHGGVDATALEGGARELRRLETAARRIGGSSHYDTALSHAVAEIRAGLGQQAWSEADRIRMVELLAGPDEALTMLGPLPLLTPLP